jgi:hypothetical protein
LQHFFIFAGRHVLLYLVISLLKRFGDTFAFAAILNAETVENTFELTETLQSLRFPLFCKFFLFFFGQLNWRGDYFFLFGFRGIPPDIDILLVSLFVLLCQGCTLGFSFLALGCIEIASVFVILFPYFQIVRIG